MNNNFKHETGKKQGKVGFLSAMGFAPSSFIDIILGTIALNILALALPFTLMQVYDRIIHQKATGTLMILVAGCAIAIVFETIVHIARDRITSWAAARYEFKGVNTSFERLLRAPLPKTESNGESTITHLQELTAFASVKNTYFVRNAQAFIDLPFSLLNLILLYVLVPNVAYFMCVLIIIVVLVHLVLLATVYKTRGEEHASHTKRDKIIMETFQLINMIRAMTTEEIALRRIEKNEESLISKTLKVLTLRSISSSFLQIIPQAAIFGVLLIGEQDVVSHKVTVGVLTTCMMLAGRCIGPIISTVSGWLYIREKHEQETNANKLLSLESESWATQDEKKDPLRGDITLNNLMFEYNEGSKVLVCNLYLTIQANTFFCFTSHNEKASNKLCDILMRNDVHTHGQILYDDFDIESIPVNNFYRDVHCLTKFIAFFKGTVLENLASFDIGLYDSAMSISKELGLDIAIASFEMGFNSILDNEITIATPNSLLLRMSIARAVIKKPRVLIINNLESGMDLDTKKFFLKALLYLKGTCTIISITNSAETLGMAQRILSLRETSVAQDDQDLKQKIERLYAS
jgi:ATP-binding cassette subfamily C protein LapB